MKIAQIGILSLQTSSWQTILNETFGTTDQSIPTVSPFTNPFISGWCQTNSGSNWTIQVSGTSNVPTCNLSGSSGGAALVNPDNMAGQENLVASSAISITGFRNLRLSFNFYNQSGGDNNPINIMVITNNGYTFNVITIIPGDYETGIWTAINNIPLAGNLTVNDISIRVLIDWVSTGDTFKIAIDDFKVEIFK